MSKSKYLSELSELLTVLSKQELMIARKFIKAFESNLTVYSKKQVQVFDLIKKNPVLSYEKLKQKVSPETNTKSFDALLLRINEKIEEALLLDINLQRKKSYSLIYKKKYALKKQLVQAHILNRKGLLLISLKLYEKIITTAKLYELYDELIEALLEKLTIASGDREEFSIKDIKSQIDAFENERKELREIKYLVQDYSASAVIKSDSAFLKLQLESNIRKVQSKSRKIKSFNAKSILLLLNLEYCAMINEPRVFIKNGLILKNMILENPAIYSERRLIYIYNKLSEADLLRHKFSSALDFSEDSLKILDKKRNNVYLTTLDIQVRNHFWNNEIESSLHAIESVLLLPLANKYPLRKTKFLFYNSIIQFQNRQFKESLSSLNELKLFEKDKEGWNLWIRIIRILCSIELLRLNLVDYDIESFRKYIQRISKEGNLNPRVDQILKILIELDRSNYDFQEVAQKRRVELINLKKTSGKYKWDIKSPEMILFHDWFAAKLENRAYEPNLEPYRLQVEKDEAKPLSKAKEKKYRSLGLIK